MNRHLTVRCFAVAVCCCCRCFVLSLTFLRNYNEENCTGYDVLGVLIRELVCSVCVRVRMSLCVCVYPYKFNPLLCHFLLNCCYCCCCFCSLFSIFYWIIFSTHSWFIRWFFCVVFFSRLHRQIYSSMRHLIPRIRFNSQYKCDRYKTKRWKNETNCWNIFGSHISHIHP